MNVSKVTTPCYCWDARDASQFICWILGYHFQRVVSFEAAKPATQAYIPAGLPGYLTGAPRTEQAPVASREESETVCCLAGVAGYAEGDDECLPCADCNDEWEWCGCLLPLMALGSCMYNIVVFPFACLALLLFGVRLGDSSSQAGRPSVRRNRPYRCLWFFPFGYCKERKYYMQPGVPPVVKKEVCTIVFCAREE